MAFSRGELLDAKVDRHHVVPSAVVPQGTRADGVDLLFRDGIAHHVEALLRGDTGVLDLLEEGDVLVTVQGVDDHASLRESFDLEMIGATRCSGAGSPHRPLATQDLSCSRMLEWGKRVRTHQEEGLPAAGDFSYMNLVAGSDLVRVAPV